MEKSGSRTTICPRLSPFCRFPFAVRINTEINTVFLVQRHFWHSTCWDVLESQRLPTHELDPVFFYTILNIGGNLTIVLELCTQIPKLDVAGSIPLSRF